MMGPGRDVIRSTKSSKWQMWRYPIIAPPLPMTFLTPLAMDFQLHTIESTFSYNETTDEFRSKLRIRQGTIKPFRQIGRLRKAVTPAPGQMCIIKRKNIRLISFDAMTTFMLRTGVYRMKVIKRSFIFSGGIWLRERLC